jgi:ATP-dependent Clp protease ATP-binding subunit ClpA
MLSNRLQLVLNHAVADAVERKHEYVTVEHVLYALLDDHDIKGIIKGCGGDTAVIKNNLETYFEGLESVDLKESNVKMTLGFHRIIQRAAFHVQSAGKAEVLPENILVAIYAEKESHAVFFLEQQEIRRLNVIEQITRGSGIDDDSDLDDGDSKTLVPSSKDRQDEQTKAETRREDVLEQFAVNLNKRAREGRIDPLIGREIELARTIQILCRRTKNNPIYVGDPGVGKTAIAEGLALRIVSGDVPEPLKKSTIYSLDLGALLAGTKFRGDFEERLKMVLKRLGKEAGAVLFIDEIHTLIGAGSVSGGSMDASNLLKPALGKGELKCIGSTTYEEFRRIFEKDRALARRFQKVDVPEPSEDDTLRILKGLRERYEAFHDVKFADAALKSAVTLSARYLKEKRLPDKAIDVIDEAGSANRLKTEGKRKKNIGVKEVEDIVAGMARVPLQAVSAEDKANLKTLAADLKRTVFGQDQAVDEVVTAIKLGRSGLGNPEKPIGSFLFAGPTGVGKTELSKELARVMGVEFLRFDMSEYMEKHTVSRLIGAPPGYVGFDQGGLLTDAISKSPHSVLLLDEIEKAHPDLFNILLQVMDYGTLTDNNGRKTDFRNVILVMTTNAGARDMSRNAIGMVPGTIAGSEKKELERVFSPEFRNRLDAVISFKALPPIVVLNVVDKFITQLEMQLLQKKVDLDVTDSARSWLAEAGYDEKMGARPLARLIHEKIKKPLADEILFGKLERGGRVSVDLTDDELTFAIAGAELPVPVG